MSNSQLSEIIKDCLLEWEFQEDDPRVSIFINEFSNWIEQFPSEYHEYVLKLTANLKYYTKRRANRKLYELYQILKLKNITDENTVFSYIKSIDGISNSSNDYWTEFKTINRINRNICYENLLSIEQSQWEYIENIVFVDDFVGTGNSVKDFIESLKIDLSNKNIFIVSIHNMFEAEIFLKEFGKSTGINIELITGYNQNKAFSNKYFEDDKLAKDKIIEISLLLGIKKDIVLGYMESESLVSFFNNTPNNTIGLFWKENNKFKPIFPRIFDKKPTWQKLKLKSKGQDEENYYNKRNTKNG